MSLKTLLTAPDIGLVSMSEIAETIAVLLDRVTLLNIDTAGLERLGFHLLVLLGGVMRALAPTAVEYTKNPLCHGSQAVFRNGMYNFKGLNEVIGDAESLATGKRFEGTR